MKGLILAGGSGTRLRPITHTSAKQLVPVANKPILYYGLEAMAEAGIREVGIIVGDTRVEVEAAVGSGAPWGLEVTYLPQERPLGLAHCVIVARPFLGDEDFLMYLGDNLLRQGVSSFVAGFEAERARLASSSGRLEPGGVAGRLEPGGVAGGGAPAAQILLARVPDPQRFGVAELDGAGEVVRLVEKPVRPPSDLALVGVYLFDARIHEAVAAIAPSARGELEITDAIQWLLDHHHRVLSQVVDGYWKDLGELDAFLEGNRLVLEGLEPRIEGQVDEASRIEGRVVVQAGAEIVRSTVRGPAIIGEGTRIEDSYIGPFTSVYFGCEVLRSEVEHSVVLEQSRIVDIPRVEDSLIGKMVEVTRTARRPRATRLMLGDHSRVDLG
ncbi:MAG: sugar phosphate nucleotidyltransferase [Acidimicrobiales bacterium]